MPRAALDRLAAIASHELRRALAKKLILALVAAAVLIEVAAFIVAMRLPVAFIEPFKESAWLFGAAIPTLPVLFMAVVIGAGTLSEEYEHGTAEITLSKPVRRSEYLFGKFLGGFSLVALIALTTTALSAILALSLFGPQSRLESFPIVFAAIAFSTLTYYSMSLMLGELIRRTVLSYIVAVVLFIGLGALGGFLLFTFFLTGDAFYATVAKLLPTWGPDALPDLIMLDLGVRLPMFETTFPGTIPEAVISIAAYSALSVSIAYIRFSLSDIPKKMP